MFLPSSLFPVFLARTADTIKNGIIPPDSFQGNAGIQMLAFTCALAGASTWVMWCTRHSAHVSSTYSLISAVAGVGVATVGIGRVVSVILESFTWTRTVRNQLFGLLSSPLLSSHLRPVRCQISMVTHSFHSYPSLLTLDSNGDGTRAKD